MVAIIRQIRHPTVTGSTESGFGLRHYSRRSVPVRSCFYELPATNIKSSLPKIFSDEPTMQMKSARGIGRIHLYESDVGGRNRLVANGEIAAQLHRRLLCQKNAAKTIQAQSVQSDPRGHGKKFTGDG